MEIQAKDMAGKVEFSKEEFGFEPTNHAINLAVKVH